MAWFIRLRWVAAPAIPVIAWSVRALLPVGVAAVQLTVIAAIIAAYNVVFALGLARLRRRPHLSFEALSRFAGAQSLADWAALTAMVHWTGGVDSPVLLFFMFHAVLASILLPTLGAFLHAASGTTLVVALLVAEHLGVVPRVPVPGFAETYEGFPRLAGVLAFFVTGILVTVWLASSISRRLRRRTRELAEVQRDLEGAYNRTTTLYDVARALSASLDLSKVLESIPRIAAGVMGTRAACLRLLSDDGATLRVEASFGLSDEYLGKGPVERARSAVDRVVLAGRPLAVRDIAAEPGFQYPEAAGREGLRSVLSVPVRAGDETIGLLRVYTAEPHDWSASEVGFLAALAGQASAALVNARAYRRLEELEAAKSRFVFAVAHQLKSPVAAVMSRLQLVRDGYVGGLTPQQIEMLEKAQGRLTGLQDLIRDLLALGALREQIAPRQVVDTDLAEAVRKAVDVMSERAREKSLSVEVSGADGLLPIRADPDEVDRLLSNLVENAVKYTPDGGRVSVALSRTAAGARIEVSDTGIGIPEEALAKVFEEFYRAPNARGSGEQGTGLGLALVRRIVELHDGVIRVDSRTGVGTTFTVDLPNGAAPGAEAAAPEVMPG
ncbi:MAG: GAF domain-containing protein [Deltaproteobacteria bacterium]|nr:GAF domain-containing protein [Deltaproteobacteria bacterium]